MYQNIVYTYWDALDQIPHVYVSLKSVSLLQIYDPLSTGNHAEKETSFKMSFVMSVFIHILFIIYRFFELIMIIHRIQTLFFRWSVLILWNMYFSEFDWYPAILTSTVRYNVAFMCNINRTMLQNQMVFFCKPYTMHN